MFLSFFTCEEGQKQKISPPHPSTKKFSLKSTSLDIDYVTMFYLYINCASQYSLLRKIYTVSVYTVTVVSLLCFSFSNVALFFILRVTILMLYSRPCILYNNQLKRTSTIRTVQLKVHKIENFFDSDFGICVISLLVMHK